MRKLRFELKNLTKHQIDHIFATDFESKTKSIVKFINPKTKSLDGERKFYCLTNKF